MRWRFAIITLAFTATTWVADRCKGVDGPASTPKLGRETIPDDEKEDIAKLQALQKFLMEKDPTLKGHRGQHPKQHGCVLATFTVADGLSDELKYGLFRKPATYRAVIRYSNGESFDDTKPDVHGMAIKLVGVKGDKASDDERETQDFVLADSEVFFMKNVKNVLAFAQARIKSAGPPPNPEAMAIFAKDHHDEAKLAEKARSRVVGNPLRVQFWSTTPYQLGSGAVKYTTRPRDPESSPATPGTTPGYLRDAMVERLSKGKDPVVFDFLVQRQSDPDGEPIEDPTVEWKAPAVKVATITIEPQGFSATEQLEFCENLSFNPWHALAEHRPLGGINRARKPIYVMSTDLRHAVRKTAGTEPSSRAEPTTDDLDRFLRPAPPGH